MKYVVLILIFLQCTGHLVFEDSFDAGRSNWETNPSSLWEVITVDGENIFHLKEPGKQGAVRAPTSRAIFTPVEVESFELSVQAKCLTDTTNKRRDICLFFGYQDSMRYYYAHFSAISDQVHNIIGLVNNADRVKINHEPAGASAAKLTHPGWYTLRVVRNADTGEIKAFVDDDPEAVLTATDKTFLKGKIGIGSFDDPAYFRHVILEVNKK